MQAILAIGIDRSFVTDIFVFVVAVGTNKVSSASAALGVSIL